MTLAMMDKVDVEQIVSLAGYEYKICSGGNGVQVNIKTCPVCGNNNYKVYLNDETGLGNCFRCSSTFNKFTFIQNAFDLSKSSVIKFVETNMNYICYRPKKTIVNVFNNDWVLPSNIKIEKLEQIPQYLIDRGITLSMAKRFDLRVCEAGFYQYTDHFGKVKFVDFSKRIIIPIKDINGNLVTFQGRDYTGKSAKKYLFPNMLPGTGRYIYNSDYIIKNNIKKIILNEGVFDVFSTTKSVEGDTRYGDWGVAGTFGKHLSIKKHGKDFNDQLADLFELQEKGVKEFVVMWDAERDAQLAAYQAALTLVSYGLPAKVSGKLPEGLDPAESSSYQILDAIESAKSPTTLGYARLKLQ